MIYVDNIVLTTRMDAMGQRLKFARCRAGYSSATKAAESLGISASTYRAHENGQNDFSSQEAARYARKFGILPAWLFFGDGRQNKNGGSVGPGPAPKGIINEINAQGKSGAGDGLSFSQQSGFAGLTFSAGSIKDQWQLSEQAFVDMGADSANIIALQVHGDSMKPTLNDGDIAFVDTSHRFASPDGLYALVDDFGGVAIKRLTQISGTGADEVRFELSFDNPDHNSQTRTADEIQIIGRYLRRFTR